MKIAALIPARKNSRRLPDKNWREVGKRPLWALAADAAVASGVCDPLVISTDDDRITHHGSIKFNAIYIRQPNFPQTYDVMMEVVKHADKELWSRDIDVDAVCLLQPTSPLRNATDIANCVEILKSRSVDSVVSVTDSENDVVFREGHAGRLERLTFPTVKPNGAVFLIKTVVLRAGGHWYGDHAYRYKMPKERSIDIDNELDLEMAQMAWAKQNGPGR